MQSLTTKTLLKTPGVLSQVYLRSFASSTFYRKDLVIETTKNPKPLPKFDSSLKFGHVSSDHLFEADWNLQSGWGTPKINPYRAFQIDPLNSTLHYAIQCFEGLKAFYGVDKKIRLFRPERNMKRFKGSCNRIALPDFDDNELLKCLIEYVKVEKRWVPNVPDFSLYLRPTAISMTDALGVRSPDHSKIYILSTPVGPYFPSGFKPIRLFAEKQHIRAFPGGYGQYKLGANYGPTIMVSKEAEKRGFHQILWLTDNKITEIGASNIFFFIKNENGEKELVTAPIDGLSLPGVVRDSVLGLAREMNQFKVSERYLDIHEFVKMVKEKRIIEAFGAGTAMTLAPVELIHYDEVDYQIPVDPVHQAGDLTRTLLKKIKDIQYGVTPHPWGVVVE